MRISLLTLLPALVICVLVDLAIWWVMRRLSVGDKWRKADISMLIISALSVLFVVCVPKKMCGDTMLTVLTYLVFFIISQYLAKVLALVAAVPLIWTRLRGTVLRWLPLAVGALVFGSMWWGSFVTRFNIDVHSEDVPIATLPPSFDGYKIVQISDLHISSFGTDTTYISEVVDRVNELQPDLIVFTGDIVTRKTDELPPFVPTLARLSAPDGVLAVKGNHDYGNYCNWPSETAHQLNNQQLDSLFAAMHWRLLSNETDTISRGDEFITVTGVEYENMFAEAGTFTASLSEAIDVTAAKSAGCHILIYHSPEEWLPEIVPTRAFALTLSGHTHAMQMEVFGLTPATFRYDCPVGLYQQGDSYLYVNRGIGTVGFPSRVGCTPEITLITLKSK